MPIPTALIGFGLSGRYLQAPFYRAHPGFTVKRVVTSRAEALAEDFPGLEPTVDVETVLADPEIQLVSIATPNATHYEYARASLGAGKHVLVDKPACATAAQLRELRDLAARKKRCLFVFQNRRWDSDFLTVQQLLKSDSVGELVNYEARYDRWKPEPNSKAWKETPGPGAGMLYDLGAHLIDQSIALFGRPEHVSGSTWIQRGHSAIPDAFELRFTYKAPLRLRLSCSLLVREPTPRYTLHGRRGSFVKYGIDVQEDQLRAGLKPDGPGFGVEPDSQAGILNTEYRGKASRTSVKTFPGRWMGLFDNVYGAIADGEIPAVPLEDIIAQLEIIESVSG